MLRAFAYVVSTKTDHLSRVAHENVIHPDQVYFSCFVRLMDKMTPPLLARYGFDSRAKVRLSIQGPLGRGGFVVGL